MALQRKRGEREGRRREAKLAVVHEGWRPRYGGGNGKEYELVNPVYLPSLEGGEAFWEAVRGVLHTRYADLEHTWVVINGDAAGGGDAGGAGGDRPDAGAFGEPGRGAAGLPRAAQREGRCVYNGLK